MVKLLPQEIDVWYLIPALRREIAKTLRDKHNLKQKEIAVIFGITEAAISQYLRSKRGTEIDFTPKDQKKIQLYAKKILEQKHKTQQHMYELCKSLRKSGAVCSFHHTIEQSLPRVCKTCKV